MSYDLGVWEGDRPADDVAAAAEFERLYQRYMGSTEPVEATARVAAYVTALLARYPDIGTEAGEDSPWSTAPLMGEARGPLVYFPMVWSVCEEVSAWAAVLAAEHGLQCFDPQWNRLRPVATDVDVARRPSNGLTCSIDRKPNDLGLRTCRNVLDMQRCGRRCTDVPIRVGSWWATR